MVTQYGNFHDFCRDSGSKWATIPVCNLFNESPARGGTGFNGCDLTGIHLDHNHVLANLGSILLDGFAILIAMLLIFLSDRKRAAVGRREMQLFLFGFLVISICEIFTIGGFPLNGAVRRGFTGVHIATVVATSWVLLLNAVVGFQLMEDGTPLSVGLVLGSSLAFFIGTGYVALDTGFSWTNYWKSTLDGNNQAYALYTLYLLLPLVFIVVFFILEAGLVVGILGEKRPLIYLVAAGLLFAIGQIFQFVISVHICNGTNGKINGGFLETFFTLLSVIMIWVFWSSITEDDWPTTTSGGLPFWGRFAMRLNTNGKRLHRDDWREKQRRFIGHFKAITSWVVDHLKAPIQWIVVQLKALNGWIATKGNEFYKWVKSCFTKLPTTNNGNTNNGNGSQNPRNTTQRPAITSKGPTNQVTDVSDDKSEDKSEDTSEAKSGETNRKRYGRFTEEFGPTEDDAPPMLPPHPNFRETIEFQSFRNQTTDSPLTGESSSHGSQQIGGGAGQHLYVQRNDVAVSNDTDRSSGRSGSSGPVEGGWLSSRLTGPTPDSRTMSMPGRMSHGQAVRIYYRNDLPGTQRPDDRTYSLPPNARPNVGTRQDDSRDNPEDPDIGRAL